MTTTRRFSPSETQKLMIELVADVQKWHRAMNKTGLAGNQAARAIRDLSLPFNWPISPAHYRTKHELHVSAANGVGNWTQYVLSGHPSFENGPSAAWWTCLICDWRLFSEIPREGSGDTDDQRRKRPKHDPVTGRFVSSKP